MYRFFLCVALMATFGTITSAAEKTVSEKAISKAITMLEAERDKAGDALEQAKIDKAIRELEALINDPSPNEKPLIVKADITPAALKRLKKKFNGRASYNPKTGELTLAYDFTQKAQLKDFDTKDKKVLLADNMMLVEGGDSLQHTAKFKFFSISTVMNFKSMRGVGIASTNGTDLHTGGQNPDTVYVSVPDGAGDRRIVPEDARSGRVPASLTVTPSKTSITYGDERLAEDTVRKDDTHQIILMGGSQGCGFSNLVIVGIPEPMWFKQILDSD